LRSFVVANSIDMIPDLLSDYDPWRTWLKQGGKYDPDYGIPRPIGMITSSSPPIVVNGVVVVLAGHEPSSDQTRIENVPADIQGYDARTGKRLWKFHVVPRPGEVGHETWENDAWKYSGNMSSWAPAAADPQLGLVYSSPMRRRIVLHGASPGHNSRRERHRPEDRPRKWHLDSPQRAVEP
jgi:hypothetical protein